MHFLASDSARSITGVNIPVDQVLGGATTAFAPCTSAPFSARGTKGQVKHRRCLGAAGYRLRGLLTQLDAGAHFDASSLRASSSPHFRRSDRVRVLP